MPFPLAKEHADPESVTTYDEAGSTGALEQVSPADVLVRQFLTAAAPLALINRTVALGPSGVRVSVTLVAQRIRLSTLPPYFTAYTRTTGSGGGSSGKPVFKQHATSPAISAVDFIGRSRDRKTRTC